MHLDVSLITESQLGSRLNNAISCQRRGEFALLLSLLSADAGDMDQFQLDNDFNLTEKLHNKFEIPPQQALVDIIDEQHLPTNHGAVFLTQGIRAYHLANCLQPEALVARPDPTQTTQEVLDNCDLHTQQKYLGKREPQAAQVDLVDLLAQQRHWSQSIIAA